MNEYLSRAFSSDEVAAALKQIHPSKSPGPDGMFALFFQKYWNIVGANVTNMVLNVLNSGMPLHDINKTNIALVPKTKNPQRMTDFRPISYVTLYIGVSTGRSGSGLCPTRTRPECGG